MGKMKDIWIHSAGHLYKQETVMVQGLNLKAPHMLSLAFQMNDHFIQIHIASFWISNKRTTLKQLSNFIMFQFFSGELNDLQYQIFL